MTGQERVMRILNRQEVDRSAYWIGNPSDEALKIYKKAFHVLSKAALGRKLGDDLAWVPIDCYINPKHPVAIDTRKGMKVETLSQGGVFLEAESADDILNWPYWPDMNCIRVLPVQTKGLVQARKHGLATFSGSWAPIWHQLTDFFGMEECFVRMYTDPDQIVAAMEKMTEFYLASNRLLFEKYGDLIDVMFFGNDMGSQLDCMISPDMFREFIFPYYKKLIDQAKSFGKKVALHSCGSIDKIIPDLINLGVDALHPIQAKAANMDAEHLQAAYGGQIVFMGGVDTQDVLPFGTVEDVRKEVLRLRQIFGKYYICSPSHEALLKNVSAEKLRVMSETAVAPLKE